MKSVRASSPYSVEQSGFIRPDARAAARCFHERRRKTTLEPESRLMLAVLEDAIRCLQNNHAARRGKGKRLFDGAQEWIFGARGDWILAFETVCSALGLDPEYIRQKLARWRKKQLGAPPFTEWSPAPKGWPRSGGSRIEGSNPLAALNSGGVDPADGVVNVRIGL